MESSVLISRIAKGYIWLKENPNNSHYKEALTLYETLVDEAKALGIKETDCWTPTQKEIDDIFTPKQADLLTD